MNTDNGSDGDVWDRAQRALDKRSSYQGESDALKERLTAYIAERRVLEAQGPVPRGVRRRGERLLNEVAALEERGEVPAKAPDRLHRELKGQGSRKPHRTPRADKPALSPEGALPNRSRHRPGRRGER